MSQEGPHYSRNLLKDVVTERSTGLTLVFSVCVCAYLLCERSPVCWNPTNNSISKWIYLNLLTFSSGAQLCSSSVILHTCTHTQFPRQEHFRRVGLDTVTTLALSLASHISHINHRDSRCCKEAKSLRLCWAHGPQVGQAHGRAHTKHCVLLHGSKAVSIHATGELHSCALPPVPKKKEALSWGSVALRLFCGFRPD